MSIRKHFFPLLIIASVAGSGSTGTVRAENTASIQAVAHVEPSLGLITADGEKGERNSDIVPGSHLYWLYYPRHEGVQLQMSRPLLDNEADCGSSVSDLICLVPEVLREYPQVSLVSLSDSAGKGDSTALTLTLIFTNN